MYVRSIQRGAVVIALLAISTLGAVAGPPRASATPSASTDVTTDFSTSFEEGQPQPAVSTVEQGPDGPRQLNVTGKASTNGSLLGSVVAVTASAENPPGEVAANLADANPDTKWLAFATTGGRGTSSPRPPRPCATR